MRQFKFRAWDKNSKEMMQPHNGDFIGWHAMTNWVEILEVMQFTGVYDKYEVEIYEGDIVKTPDGDGHIEYDRAQFWAVIDGVGIPLDCYAGIDGDEKICRVIGNKFENPELLSSEGVSNES